MGVMGPVPFQPTITREQVARAQGLGLEGIKALNDKKVGMEKMAEGACVILKELYDKDELDGVAALGGTMGTALAVTVMKVVPLGVPKIIVSTIAYSPTVSQDVVGGDDLMMLPWVGGLWGLNSLSKRSLETAAGAISGAAEEYDKEQIKEGMNREIVGATGMGFTSFYKDLKPALGERGYDLAVFHSTGMSGRILERAIRDGLISGVLDLCVGKELLEEVAGGVYTGGKHRLEAAGRMGIPQIVSQIGMGVWCWPGGKPLPPDKGVRMRKPYNMLHDDVIGTPEECTAAGKLMAEKLNKATGPTVVVIPNPMPPMPKGPTPGGPPMNQEMQKQMMEEIRKIGNAFKTALLRDLSPQIKVVAMEDVSMGDPKFVETILELFDEMMPQQ